jgi:large subunit ribosomal protein L18
MKKRLKKLYLQEKKRSLKKIFGTPEKPRLSVFRSHQHIYGQLIDDRN